MNRFGMLFMLAGALSAPAPVGANGFGQGLVERIALTSTATVVIVRMQSETTDQPDCHTSSGWDFAFSLDTQQGRAIYAGLLTAQQTKTPVSVAGSGACDAVPNMETLEWLVFPQTESTE